MTWNDPGKVLGGKKTSSGETSTEVTYNMSDVKLRLNAAVTKALQYMPYLGMAMYSMIRIPAPGLGTFATDKYWRFYYDPAKVMEWTPDELAGVMLHEVSHCIRDHSGRFEGLNEPVQRNRVFNVAGDALINDNLKETSVKLPEGAIYVNTLQDFGAQVDKKMTAEQVYYELLKVAEDMCTCSKCGDGDRSSQGGDQNGDGGGQNSDQNSDGEDSSGQGGEGSSASGQHQHGNGFPNPSCPIHGGQDCGSIVGGERRSYEIDNTGENEGVNTDRAEIIRDKTAVSIKEHVKSRGSIPGGWERWAENRLNPKVDWRKEFASIIRRTTATISGTRDYTYKRPSRRAPAMRNMGSNIVLPAMRKPEPPHVAIVFDTSGSMSDDMLSWGLAEISGILKNIGSTNKNITLIACDAQTGKAQKIRNIDDITLQGGGGTDMRVGISEAVRPKNGGSRPQIVVVITDGYTPWPDTPLKNTHMIVALTAKESVASVPSWAKTVIIERD